MGIRSLASGMTTASVSVFLRGFTTASTGENSSVALDTTVVFRYTGEISKGANMTREEIENLTEDERWRLMELYIQECDEQDIQPSGSDFDIYLQEH